MILTDLQRIEIAFPAEAMLHVVDHGADPKDPTAQRVRRLLVGIVDEASAGLADRDLRRLRTRLNRTMRTFLAPVVAIGGRVDVVGVIAWRVLAAVLEADVFVLSEGTPLSDALEETRPARESAAGDPMSLPALNWNGQWRCDGCKVPGFTRAYRSRPNARRDMSPRTSSTMRPAASPWPAPDMRFSMAYGARPSTEI